MLIAAGPSPSTSSVTSASAFARWSGEPSSRPARERPLLVGQDISPAEAARLSDEGLLARCVADIVICTGARLDRETRAECLLLLMRREGVDPDQWVVGHEAAAWVHLGALAPGAPAPGALAREEDPVRGSAPDAVRSRPADPSPVLEQVVVLGPRGRSARYAGVVRQRQAALDEDEIIAVSGILVTSPARTAADLLRLLAPATAAVELDRLRAATAVTVEAMDAALRRRRGARGLAGAQRTLRAWGVTQRQVPS